VDKSVNTLVAFDDGSGPALIVGGSFNKAGEVFANNIAKWNGTAWSTLLEASTGLNKSALTLLTISNESTEQSLIAGGGFTTAGNLSANRVVQWDEPHWSPLAAR
jgi:hypothetical protein